jgi:hypothetical protein
MAEKKDIGEGLKRLLGSRGVAVEGLVGIMYNLMVANLPASLKDRGLWTKEDIVINALMDYAKQHGYLYMNYYTYDQIVKMIDSVRDYSTGKLSE